MSQKTFAVSVLCLIAWSGSAYAQETRGGITGKVTDPQNAPIPGAPVVVTNTETGVAAKTVTNQTGYFEANLLNAGTYSVAVESTGFKKYVRSGIILSVAARLDLDVQLQIGQALETVEVTADAPLLDTTTASGGRVIDNKQIMQLPFSDLNPFVLAGLAPGMQWTGRPDYRRPFDNAGTSGFNTMGAVGNNEYTIDGASNMRGSDVAYVPPADAVEEFKLETSAFDAAQGHTSGATINVMTKAGTNDLHGSLYDQHWQKRWNATQHFQRLQFEDDVRTGKKKATDQKNLPGRQNYFGAGAGGPVYIPKIVNGRNKLFFYFMYSGIWKDENEPGSDAIRSVPKMAWRAGDFSDLLAVDAVKYTIYDPRSAVRGSDGVVRRTPFPGNKGIPVLNPMYKTYEPLYPKPNDVPGLVSPEGLRNYFASTMPKNERFKSAISRVDYNVNQNHRLYGRVYYNHRLGNEYDWMIETKPGLQSNGITRNNYGLGLDHVWTINSANVMNITFNLGQYQDGNSGPRVEIAKSYKPSDVGLPAYLDAKAGDFHRLPGLDFNDITDVDNGFPTIGNRATTGSAKLAMSSIRGRHSLRYGYDERRYWSARSGPGNSSGNFTFRNNYVRAADNTSTASNHALDWATFMMGMPTGISVDTNDSAMWSTRYRALYVQDDFRITNRFRLNLGLRYEGEGGSTERFNRGIAGGFDFDTKFVFSDAVEAAYAASPLTEQKTIQVRGAGSYLGAKYNTFSDGTHKFLPKVGAVYQISSKTVLRAGYGLFYDTFNVLVSRPSQSGYSQSTSTTITNDNGLTFCCGLGAIGGLATGRTILNDPFPTRADGSRFDTPYGNSLGANIFAGRGFTLPPRDFSPAKQHRWRVSVQREITKNIVVDASYNASYARIPVNQRIDYLPQQYWATGNVRNQAVDDDMNRNIANPFNINNLASLKTSSPVLYNYLSTQGFFTSANIRKNQLLRQYPNLNGSNGVRPGADTYAVMGRNKYHDLQLQVEKRFSRGFHTSFMYTWSHGEEADYYNNEFDPEPTVYRPQDALRPHRLAWTMIYEFPFGKGKRFATGGPLAVVAGGWQLSWIYQYQNGQATDWGNRFFSGSLDQIGDLFKKESVHAKDIHQWFDSSIAYTGTGAMPSGFTGFDGRSSAQPGSFHVRVFPTRLSDLRTDGIRGWDVKLQKSTRIKERLSFLFAVDLLNATNHTNFGGPVTDPTNRDFGKVTATNGYARVIQLNGRIQF